MASEPRQPRLGGQRPTPIDERAFCPLWMGKGRVPYGFTLLDTHILGFNTHYLDARIHPCTAELGSCLPCRQGYLPRWRGFIGARRAQTGGRYVVQVTPAAYRESEQLRLLDGRLRGSNWTIWRAGDTKQARWVWKFCGNPGEDRLPEGNFILRVMSNVWGIDLAQLDKSPPQDGDCRPMLRPYARHLRRKDR